MTAGDVFVNNIVPIFLVAALGFALRRVWGVEKRAVSQMAFYVLSPCLIFSVLIKAEIAPAELARLGAFALVSIVAMGGLAWGVSRWLRLDRSESMALVLVAMFSNAANYGLPLNQLRYGPAGVAHAVPYIVVSGVLVYTLGSFIASLGQHPWRQALVGLARLPVIYAAALALVIYGARIPLPAFLMQGLDLAAAGAIPAMLVLLGMQLADWQRWDQWRLVLPAVGLRLIISPLVAGLGVVALALTGQSRATSILEASMPVAVAATIVASEYDLHPEAVAGAVVVSTLISPLTLTAVIQLYGL